MHAYIHTCMHTYIHACILGTPNKTRTDVSRLPGMRAASTATEHKLRETGSSKQQLQGRPSPEMAWLYDSIFFAAADMKDTQAL